jgi:hypothetical protein
LAGQPRVAPAFQVTIVTENTVKNRIFKTAGMLLFAGTVLTGCATIEKNASTDTEEMLAAAGFKVKIADTAEKIAHLQSMQQRKLLTHIKDGSVYYAYADAQFCKCMYMGSEKNYQEYQKLHVEQTTAEMNQAAAMDWDSWGGWGGWGPW